MDQVCNSHAIDWQDMCSVNESLRNTFDHAANSIFSTMQYSFHKPWISSLSLSLIAKRDAARATGDHAEEMALCLNKSNTKFALIEPSGLMS